MLEAFGRGARCESVLAFTCGNHVLDDRDHIARIVGKVVGIDFAGRLQFQFCGGANGWIEKTDMNVVYYVSACGMGRAGKQELFARIAFTCRRRRFCRAS